MKNKNVKKLKKILDKYNIEEDYDSILYLLEKDLKDKKYGLVWEEGKENIELLLEEKTPYIKEVKELRIDNNSSNNHAIIEGDNLLGLMALEKAKKKVDVIYIDPPYNTGNEFIYNDKIVNKEDRYRHSKWISFMDKRLRLARMILDDKGAIFISIDYRELGNLKLLMDEIFGEENLISIITVKTANNVYGSKASYANKTVLKTNEFLLAYAKNKDKLRELRPLRTAKKSLLDSHYSTYLDKDLKRDKVLNVLSKDSKIDKFINGKMTFQKLNNLFNINTGIYDYFLKEYADNIYMDSAYNSNLTEEEEKQVSQGKIIKKGDNLVFRTRNGKGTLRHYTPLSKSIFKSNDYNQLLCDTAIRGSIWDYADDMANIGKEGGVEFDNGKKPIRLIKDILTLMNNPNAIVLDFFAGSGTTLHAVMELNDEDNGKRQCILINNNEVSNGNTASFLNKYYGTDFKVNKDGSLSRDKKNNKKFNEYINSEEFSKISQTDGYKKIGICRSLTYKRNKNVINQKFHNNNLYYYKIDFLDNNSDYYEIEETLINFSKELIKLRYNAFNKLESKDEFEIFTGLNYEIYIYTGLFITDEIIYKINSYKPNKEKILYILKENINDLKIRNINVDKVYPIPDSFIRWFNI